jgi:hypothetical protein
MRRVCVTHHLLHRSVAAEAGVSTGDSASLPCSGVGMRRVAEYRESCPKREAARCTSWGRPEPGSRTSSRGRGGWFARSRIRWCLPIAPVRYGDHLPIRIPPKRGWPPAAFHPSPVPDTPRRLVPRRPARHASAHHGSTFRRERAQRKRHEKTLLTLLTLCEAILFADSAGQKKTQSLNQPLRLRCSPLQKTRMAPFRIPSLSRSRHPHAGSCLADPRAMPPLTTDPRFRQREQRNRHEKTPLTPLTPCEAFFLRIRP